MLPYFRSPFAAGDRPLVMTSGNLGDEPIARGNAEALAVWPLADLFLLHDRPIQTVCDDSVVRLFEGRGSPGTAVSGLRPLSVPCLGHRHGAACWPWAAS